MKKKSMILLIISLIMIICVGAVSAADTNDTSLEEVSDPNIATASVAFEQVDNATSLESEVGSDAEEISVDDSQDEISNPEVGDATSNSNNGVLSASNDDLFSSSNDDLVKAESECFYYNGVGYQYFYDAIDYARDHGGGEIFIKGGTYTDSTWHHDIEFEISSSVHLNFSPLGDGGVVFDGGDTSWLFRIASGTEVTFNHISFTRGESEPADTNEGGAFEVKGKLNLNNCIFVGNKAKSNYIGGYGLGGAINVDEGSLIARNCEFTNNWAGKVGGAICSEDGGSVELYDCTFKGNKKGYDSDEVENDFDVYGSSTWDLWTFTNCEFIGHGNIVIVEDPLNKAVTINPQVSDTVHYLALYKDGSYYDGDDCAPYRSKTFSNLEAGTYKVYMMENFDDLTQTYDKRYDYSKEFTIIEPNFVLNGEKVFDTLSAAVNNISSGGTGIITVAGGTYTGSSNLNVQIINKDVTIRPKSASDEVTFSGDSQNYFLYIRDNSKLTMEYITITGKFSDSALKFNTLQVCTISDCVFKNIKNSNNQPGNPINAQSSNLVLNDHCNFESNGPTLFKNTVVNIDECTFTSNSGTQGGAINADSSSDLTVTNSEFNSNGASEGGAIYASNLKVSDTEFTYNSAGIGGAVYITSRSDSIINITNCVFDSNTATYRNIYSESLTRKINLRHNEYDLDLKLTVKDASYGREYIIDGVFDWGSNLNNTYTFLTGIVDEGTDKEDIFGDLLTVEDNKFKINVGVLSGGSHNFTMDGMYYKEDGTDLHFNHHYYYIDLYENEFFLDEPAYAKTLIEKANITLNLEAKNVLIPEVPVLNVYANWDLNYTIFIGNNYYQVQVVNGKGSMKLTGLDLGNYTVVGMRDGDQNFNLVMNFTTFSISKTYSNFLVLSTNVEYDTLAEAVANSNNDDTIYVKKGTYKDTGIVISNKTLDIIALDVVVFDAQGTDANFIIVNKDAEVQISGITFRGLHNRNTNYGAIVNHGDLSLDSCNFTDNKITKISFAGNGGAAIFSDGDSLDIDNCNFIRNTAPLKVSTAAVTSLGYEDVSITDSKFINNSAREGGALHFKNISQFESAVVSCEFEQNTAVKGSAIYVSNNSRYMAVTSSGFKKNDIKNNLGENAQLEGGVIYVNANTTEVVIDISLSNFESNSNGQVDGGVICLDGISKANIDSCIFTNNLGKLGSVVLIKNPYDKKLFLIIDDSKFIGNNATNGAIATSPKVTTLIDECIFANNTGENRHIHSNGFTVVHDSIFEVKDVTLNALSVQYGESSIIRGTADVGTNIFAVANLTVANENTLVEIDNNTFSYKTGILNHGKYYAVLNGIADANNNTYLMDSITEIFRVSTVGLDLNVSVDNITYGETLTVIERLSQNATGTVDYQLNGRYYTKEEIESLKLDAGKYTLVAIYDHEDYTYTSSIINFEVYKANPTITVADVEIEYGDSIILNIETNVPSIYIIEIEDYKNAVFVNGSRSVEIEKTLDPGNYTIKVTSQERVNYKSNSTEANLKVNRKPVLLMLSVSNRIASPNDVLIEVSAPDDAVGNVIYTISDSNKNTVNTIIQSCRDDLIISGLDAGSYELNAVSEGDGQLLFTSNSLKFNVNNGNALTSPDDNNLGGEYGEGRFIYQYDEDSDYVYYDTLEEAIAEVELSGAGIITVRGGTYSGDEFCGFELEGELELTIRALEGEEVIFDCENGNYFLHLKYGIEVEFVETPVPHIEEYQTEGPTVTLENITVINGYNSEGGAIEIDAGTLNLTNCNFRNNKAGSGGAIYIGDSDLIVEPSEYDATVIAINTTFTNNYASDEGGAIYIEAGSYQDVSASFLLCTFLDNYQGENEEYKMNYFAGGDAGEIVCKSCVFNGTGEIYSIVIDKINQTVTINGTSNDTFNSVVLMYSDLSPLYSIYNKGARDFYVTFEDVIGGNYTLGIMNDHDFNIYVFGVTFEMKVPNFIISEEEVYETLTEAIDAVAENGIIYANANYHDEENLEIDIGKSFTLKNFRDRDVVFDGSGANWFFTIAEGCAVEFDGISFTDGGIKFRAAIENYGTLVLNNCSFNAFETGAVIYNSGLLNILNGEFSLNSIDNAIVWNDANLVIKGVEFSGNTVNVSSAVYNNGVAEIIDSNFTGNSNGGNGGAIYNTNSLIINNTVFNENEGKDGGAIYNTGVLSVFNSTFEDNSADGYGGAIYNENELNVFNSTFTGGSSEKDGGAIYNNNEMFVYNSTFVGNSATLRGGAIYNNKTLKLVESFFGINFADEFANIYNAGDIQFSGNTFDFYDVILYVPDGQYGIPTTITGTLNPEFNMDIRVTLPGFVNNKDANVTISDGVFEYNTGILPKGIYPVNLAEVIYDSNYNIYYGKSVSDRLIIHKANVYINLTVDDVVLPGSPVLKISTSKNGLFTLLFNNKFSNVTITDGHYTLDLGTVGEGDYTVWVVREGDENYNDAANSTTFAVSVYEGKFIVNSTGNQFETLREALSNSLNDDIIYVREGNYSGDDNIGLTISDKKLTIISLGDVVFDANSTDSSFLTVGENADVTIDSLVITGFNHKNKIAVINNNGNLTVDNCVFIANTINDNDCRAIIYNEGNLNIVESEFSGNVLKSDLIRSDSGLVNINESTFENNIFSSDPSSSVSFSAINIYRVNSAKLTSNVFFNNQASYGSIIKVMHSNIRIESEFYNNTAGQDAIYVSDSNLTVSHSTFSDNTMWDVIYSIDYSQNVISECIFTNNTVKNVLLMDYNVANLSVINSIFSDNKISQDNDEHNSAISIRSPMNASVDGCVFSSNKANKYRNIYSVCDLNISNSVFDALNVDYSVYDIDYGKTETIEGSIDIGINRKFTVNLDINNKIYSVNVTNNEFTYNSGVLNGGDYNVILSAKDSNSNTFVFDKMTKIFTVHRVDPGLNISIADITQGEKLNVTLKINRSTTARVFFELNGNRYNKTQLENLTLGHGNYLITAVYKGDKNYLPATKWVNVVVRKVTPNITVSDVVVNYTDEIKVNVTTDVSDYYTVFIGDESVSLYVEDSAIFTFSSVGFKPDIYEIIVYVFESDDYAEAYANATLTLNKAVGVFNLSDNLIDYGENATIRVEVPLNAYGNITYKVYDRDMELVYNITQSCLEELVVPNLPTGKYTVTGTFEGDFYYSDGSEVNSGTIFVNPVINIIVSNITYSENANVTIVTVIDGDYLVYVGNRSKVVTVINGAGNWSVSDLGVGSYIVNVTIMDGNYSAFNSTSFTVEAKQIAVSVSVENITYGENASVIVVSELDEEYLVYVGGDPYYVNVTGGKGNFSVDGLNAGGYVVNVTIVNGNYSAFNSTTFEVAKADSSVQIDYESVTYGTSSLTLKLSQDASGNVSVYVNGKFSQIVNLVNGSANITVSNLVIGNNKVSLAYSGDDNYNPFNKSVSINRKSTIQASYMTRGYNSGMDYTAKLFDSHGSPLANTAVSIKVDTKTYTVKTDSNGVFKLNKKLAVGYHAIAIVNPVTGEYKLTNMKIVKRITGNKNVKIFFADGTNYKVRIVGDDGKYVGAGKVVKINIGGKTYSVVTNKYGYANLKLSLKVSKYTITVKYKGFTTKNKVIVKSVVKPIKKFVKVKRTAKKLKLKVKLKGKKVLKKKKVFMKFRGKTYKAKTNKRGIATFKVPKKVIQKLKKGYKYRAVFTYKAKANGKIIKNTARCKVKAR